MNRLPKKKISLVAAAAAVAGGPTTAAAQAQRRGRHASESFLLHHHQTDDRALRSDGDANATTAATVPEVASIIDGTATGGPRSYMVGLTSSKYNLPSANYPAYFTDCGGTLIAPSVVLTAAHCMYDDGNWDPVPVDQVLVNLYDKNEQAGVVIINIEDPSEGGKDIVVHQDYKPGENDIALMFLPVPVGQVADYAKINDDPNLPVVPGDPLRVMGWGRTESTPGSESDVLLETTVDYISNAECKEIYADFTAFFGRKITDGNMCGYKIDTAHCSGDSGGPLFLVDEDGDIGNQPTQLGIVSWSEKPCGTYPGVYTRVSYYAEWIKETVCSRPEHATKELCGSSKSGKSTKSSPYAP